MTAEVITIRHFGLSTMFRRVDRPYVNLSLFLNIHTHPQTLDLVGRLLLNINLQAYYTFKGPFSSLAVLSANWAHLLKKIVPIDFLNLISRCLIQNPQTKPFLKR